MSGSVEIRHRDTGAILFTASMAPQDDDGIALGCALAAAVGAGADLAGAELRDANAQGVPLTAARLAGACLTGAVLDECDMSGAILTDASMLRVSAIGASFDRADLGSAHLWAAVLTGASFNGTQAAGANFDDSAMQRVDLRGADLTDASLLRTDLSGADLRGAKLEGTDMRGAKLDEVTLERDGTNPVLGIFAPDETIDGAENRSAPSPTVFHWKPRWLMRAGPGAAMGAILAGWMSIQIAVGTLGKGSTVFGRAILAALFAAFTLSLGGAAITYVAALFRQPPVVTIDAAGIRDSRVSDMPIAWADITGWLPVLYGGQMMLMLDVTAPGRIGLPRNPLWAVNRLCSRWLGRPELSIRMTGLEGSIEALLGAIQAARPAEPGSTTQCLTSNLHR